MNETALIIGGDERYIFLEKYLSTKGMTCSHIKQEKDMFLMKNISQFGSIILPVPLSKDAEYIFSSADLKLKITEAAEKIQPHHKVFFGGAKQSATELFKSKTQYVYDFMQDEALTYFNACLTAQGTLRLLLENTKEYIRGKKCLVLGYGRVAETLSDVLLSQGCDVYVALRNPSVAVKAQHRGCKTLEFSLANGCIYLFDYIFGTVPQKVLEENSILHIKDDAVYFELASPPFSAEKSSFEKYGKKYVSASALPGRFTPESAAKAIGDFILKSTQ